MMPRRRRWSADVPVAHASLEVGEVLLRGGDGFGLVFDGDIGDAVGGLHVHRADLLGEEDAEAAAFDHRRAAHADVRVGGGDDDVAAAQQGGVPGEAAARNDADGRHVAAQAAHRGERGRVQRAAGESVVRRRCGLAAGALAAGAGAAAAAFGEEHDRDVPLLGDLEHAVGLGVVDGALRAGKHGVVVGEDNGAGGVLVEEVAVDAPDAGDHAVGRELVDDLLHRQARAGREHEAAVLHERAGIAEVVDVLAGGALAGLAAAGDGVRAGRRRA